MGGGRPPLPPWIRHCLGAALCSGNVHTVLITYWPVVTSVLLTCQADDHDNNVDAAANNVRVIHVRCRNYSMLPAAKLSSGKFTAARIYTEVRGGLLRRLDYGSTTRDLITRDWHWHGVAALDHSAVHQYSFSQIQLSLHAVAMHQLCNAMTPLWCRPALILWKMLQTSIRKWCW